MILLANDVEALVYEDLEGWEKVESEIYDTSRWETWYTGVFKNGGKFYSMSWTQGSTETQGDYFMDTELREIEKIVIFADLIEAIEGADGVADEDIAKLKAMTEWRNVHNI